MTDLALETLEARGLIRVAAIHPELEYLFRHALLQDTAYESLLKQERRALHQLVGQTIEDLYPERAGELAAVLAMHFEQAGDRERAVEYLTQAASFAMRRHAIVEGYDLYTRAEALLPPSTDDDTDAVRRRRVEIVLGRARAGFMLVSPAQAVATLEAAVDDAERLSDRTMTADVHSMIALMRQFSGDQPGASAQLDTALARVAQIARELDDPTIAAVPDSIVGVYSVFSGRLAAGVALLEKAAPHLENKHDFVGSSFALVALALGLARMGRFEESEDAVRRAFVLAEKGDLIARLDSQLAASTVRSIRGDLDTAASTAIQCTEIAEETGAIACVVASNFVLGDILDRQGRHGEARRALRRGNEVASAIADNHFRPSIAAYLRANAAFTGEAITDADSFEEALAASRRHGDLWAEADITWKRATTALQLRGTPAGATLSEAEMLNDFELASSAFAEMGARPFQARVLREWGTALRAVGRAEEGDDRLRAALTLLDDVGITREADELRELLASS